LENPGIWQLVKYGFWLGIGFIIPLLLFTVGSTFVSILAMPTLMEASMGYVGSKSSSETDDEGSFSSFGFSNYDISSQVEIQNYRSSVDGNRVLILGSIINNSEKQASSIQLEAEFTDENGEFVYECTDYISQKLKPSQSENFQISCGCGDNPFPTYSEFTVRVTSASSL